MEKIVKCIYKLNFSFMYEVRKIFNKLIYSLMHSFSLLMKIVINFFQEQNIKQKITLKSWRFNIIWIIVKCRTVQWYITVHHSIRKELKFWWSKNCNNFIDFLNNVWNFLCLGNSGTREAVQIDHSMFIKKVLYLFT